MREKKFYTYKEIKDLIYLVRSSENNSVKDAEPRIMRWLEENLKSEQMLDFANYFNNNITEKDNTKIHIKNKPNIFFIG